MRSSPLTRVSALTALWAAVLALTASTALASSSVLPADVKVGIHTVSEAARRVAPSNLSPEGCSQEALPDRLPFRNLCAQRQVLQEGGGLVFRGERSVAVRQGRTLFTVMGDVTNGDPVIGTYPGNNAQARDYWFDEDQLGGSRGTVTIDGAATRLGRAYVVGPYKIAPLADGSTRVVSMATFIAPLSIGTHVVHKTVTFDGKALQETYGIDFLRIEDTFRVTVRR